MQTTVAVWLGMLDVIFLLEQNNIILSSQQLRYRINILHKRANNADARNVMDMLPHISNRSRKAKPIQLFDDADRSFQPRFYGLHRVALVFYLKSLVQHLDFGFDLQQGTFVIHQHLFKWLY